MTTNADIGFIILAFINSLTLTSPVAMVLFLLMELYPGSCVWMGVADGVWVGVWTRVIGAETRTVSSAPQTTGY